MNARNNKDAKHQLFARKNYVMLLISCILIVLGLFLMSGKGSTFTHFETDIFSFRRTVSAPIITLAGYVSAIVAILYRGGEQ